MDAITLLKQDHKTVEALFKKFEKAGEAKAAGAGAALVDRVRDKASAHTRATA